MRLRAASFNLENLDDRPGLEPPLAERLPALRRILRELDADVLLLQEVNAQRRGKRGRRSFRALEAVLETTPYAAFERAATLRPGGDGPSDVHNLVVLSRHPVAAMRQLHHDLVAAPLWPPATATPPGSPAPVTWDRPLLHVALRLPSDRLLHVVDLHLRAPIATPVAGQKESPRRWHSVGAWAEGNYLSTMKRTGQALEARLLVDRLFAAEPEALLLVGGDLNAEANETPLRTLLGAPEDTGNEALAAQRLVALEEGVPEERRFTVRHAGRRVLLDHLLASPALAACCRSVEIRNAGLRDETAAVSPPLDSYHAALVAEFAL